MATDPSVKIERAAGSGSERPTTILTFQIFHWVVVVPIMEGFLKLVIIATLLYYFACFSISLAVTVVIAATVGV